MFAFVLHLDIPIDLISGVLACNIQKLLLNDRVIGFNSV